MDFSGIPCDDYTIKVKVDGLDFYSVVSAPSTWRYSCFFVPLSAVKAAAGACINGTGKNINFLLFYIDTDGDKVLVESENVWDDYVWPQLVKAKSAPRLVVEQTACASPFPFSLSSSSCNRV